MDDDKKVLRLSEHEGVDRLNNLDQFLRAAENDAVEIDLSGKDVVPTSVVQTVLAAALHWTQRDVGFSIVGCSEGCKKNLVDLGVDFSPYFKEETA